MIRATLGFYDDARVELPRLECLKVSNVSRPDLLLSMMMPGLADTVALRSLSLTNCARSEDFLENMRVDNLRMLQLYRCSRSATIRRLLTICKDLQVLKIRTYQSDLRNLLPSIRRHRNTITQLWLEERLSFDDAALFADGSLSGRHLNDVLDLSTFPKLTQIAIPTPARPEKVNSPP